ncbi:MAG: hypothetical protein CVU93_00010 [Firmicutes bacterium HGW-Firmicutes-18]|nr:MAG: hypothetical protein CVU93_00010 [Firmicutes bacterium HGW-Firmicutes-18]
MKVLIIGFTKMAYMPYMKLYLDEMKNKKCEVHLFYWNRDEKEDIRVPDNLITHEFHLTQKDEQPKWTKIINFIKYRKYAKKTIDLVKPDRIIVLSTLPAVLLSKTLCKGYKCKYIFDYRDITFEKLSIFRSIISKIVNNSYCTMVSSDAYRRYLPRDKNIYSIHNIIPDALLRRDIRNKTSRNHKPIRIRYWGFIRHEEINKQFINKFFNDDRFELYYHGRIEKTAQNLLQHCKDNNFTNVFFHGSYLPEDKYKIIEDTDIIHNVYNNDFQTQQAMGNKYYDGLIHYLPQICNKGSFMGELIDKHGTGININLETKDVSQKIFEYYRSIDWDLFKNRTDIALESAIGELVKCRNVIKKFLDKR